MRFLEQKSKFHDKGCDYGCYGNHSDDGSEGSASKCFI